MRKTSDIEIKKSNLINSTQNLFSDTFLGTFQILKIQANLWLFFFFIF
jgi:hypothetical protein